MNKTQTAWSALARPPWKFWASSWPWRGLAYALVSALLCLALVVVLPVAAVSVVGLPLLAMAVSAFERRRTTWMGTPAQASGHAQIPVGQRSRWLAIRFCEPVTWREVGALVVSLLTHAVTACVLLALAAVLVSAVAIPVEAQARIDSGEPGLVLILVGDDPWEFIDPPWLLSSVVAVVGLLGGAYLVTFLSAAENSLQRLLYEPRPHEQARELRRLLVSRDALVKAQVAERKRLERDLHDGVQQDLVVLATRLAHVEIEVESLKSTGADVSGASLALDGAQRTLENVSSTLRDTVRGLHPAALGNAGLAHALEELAGRTSLPLCLDTSGYVAGGLGEEEEAALYYVANEGVNNAIKHSGASEVRIILCSEGDRVKLEVVDQGRGGALNGSASWGTGLRGLRERMEAHGGFLLVESEPGRGTRLTAALPTHRTVTSTAKEQRAHPVG